MNHRLSRVRELIKRELGPILDRNFTFAGSVVTIHEVDVTPDLKQCFIYVGILGREHAAPNIVRKLNENRGLVQRELFKRVILKNSPSLTFKYDTSIERGVRVLTLIENLPEPLPDEEPVAEDESKKDDVKKGDGEIEAGAEEEGDHGDAAASRPGKSR
ncbi:30S ribosome-binding factor RbfA [Verrucomicrobium sp. BvORR106]|uniref:30S ribosome-binding factor RbfA n=1 Tax=Verrucomicrobium sp. BvORR106 TaxID=1403819 RepID=UPI00068B47F2|nr:30S ribosome-binding factor RbfA [Verrucomicrobium sp. BvORR106]